MTRANSAFELLQAANPVPATRPARKRRGVPVVLAFAAIVLCFLLVAPAVGIDVPPLNFWKAEKAPPKVVQDFETLSEGAPPGMDPGAISGETRKVRLADGQTLWVAPTRHGGFCTLGAGGGGCDKLGTVPLSVSWTAARVPLEQMTRRGGPPTTAFDAISGHVKAKYADAVEVRFADGERERLDLAWVSEPIGAGFFLYTIPSEHRRTGHEIVSVVALDGEGRVVVQDARGRGTAPPPDAVMEEKDAAVRVTTSRGEAVVWKAPTRYEGRCAWLEYLGRDVAFLPCMPRGYDWGFPFRFVPTRSNVLLVGAVRTNVTAIEIQFRDGERMRVTPREGFVLAELPRAQLVAGREATTILLRDRHDNVVPPRIPVAGLRADREPCFGPLPLVEDQRGPQCLSF